MSTDTLVIVFGAGGRLGARLLPILANEPAMVVAVTRNNTPGVQPRGIRRMRLDVTNPDECAHSLDVLTGIARAYRYTVLVDLILNRATVTTMRTSITAAASYVLRLHERLRTTDQFPSLVSASTTATLAPWLYQTPYGLAKRHQLVRYVNSGISGTAFLFPSLAETPDDKSETVGLRWIYTGAACKLAAAITRPPRSSGSGRVRPFRLVVPETPIRRPTGDNYTPRARISARQLLATHAPLLLGRWDSPQQHREASRHRLAMTPESLREYVDHHTVPPFLLRRLVRALNDSVEIERYS